MANKNRERHRIDPQTLDPETRRRIKRRREQRRRERRRRALILRSICAAVMILLIAGIVTGISAAVKSSKEKQAAKEEEARQEQLLQEEKKNTRVQKIAEAKALAEQYDYEAAIETIKSIDNAMQDPDLVTILADYEEARSNLKAIPASKITHLMVRTLIADPQLVFTEQKDTVAAQNSLTVDEFQKMLQQLYDNGYVLVSIHDMVSVNDDGEMGSTSVYLPEGKKPFILSQEDVCYDTSLAGKGYATKMILQDGKIVSQYQQADGTVITGAYDVVPIVDAFIEEHPDFSYRGARGLLGFSGEYGILGYQTSPADTVSSETSSETSTNEEQETNEETSVNNMQLSASNTQEIANVKPVIEALKAEGWEFASSSYSHISYAENFEQTKADADNWETYVESVIGETDVLFFPYGTDIADYTGYDDKNETYVYLKNKGFKFFCNIDSSQYWVQIATDYVRQGRRSIDGLRLYQDSTGETDRLSDLFDASLIYDASRPDFS